MQCSANGTRVAFAFERGVLTQAPRAVVIQETGTVIWFRPDNGIFTGAPLSVAQVKPRLAELAWLCPGLVVTLQGKRIENNQRLVGYANLLAGGQRLAHSSALHQMSGDVEVEVAGGWRDAATPQGVLVRSFVNCQDTECGSYVEDMLSRLARVRPLDGLVAVLHVGLLEPRFGGPTQAVSHMKEAREAVEEVLGTI